MDNKFASIEDVVLNSRTIQKILREIKNVDAKSDTEYNQLRLTLKTSYMKKILHSEWNR